ncbi:hypothetical protein EUGRSUZ_I02566 [Eucalyptus grandis]|uniref:Uncharacterized protein n=2 Tax=Eucalyptus grandis TaxID=71139 RepID=A0ACC3JK31_EUCGR|nr:hypothetical protein EUGRSUZ_I02566 [Eucalyptus grandis]
MTAPKIPPSALKYGEMDLQVTGLSVALLISSLIVTIFSHKLHWNSKFRAHACFSSNNKFSDTQCDTLHKGKFLSSLCTLFLFQVISCDSSLLQIF